MRLSLPPAGPIHVAHLTPISRRRRRLPGPVVARLDPHSHSHTRPQRVVAWLDPSNATSHSTPVVVVSPDPQLCYRSLSLPVSRARFTAPPTPPSHASIPLSNPCPRGGRMRVSSQGGCVLTLVPPKGNFNFSTLQIAVAFKEASIVVHTNCCRPSLSLQF